MKLSWKILAQNKIKTEVAALVKREPIDTFRNPLKFYCENEKDFPYLSRYIKNNSHFQPTSVASERIFNKDSLIYSSRRSSLAAEVSEFEKNFKKILNTNSI